MLKYNAPNCSGHFYLFKSHSVIKPCREELLYRVLFFYDPGFSFSLRRPLRRTLQQLISLQQKHFLINLYVIRMGN